MRWVWAVGLFVLGCLVLGGEAGGVVHSGRGPGGEWGDRPGDELVGRWGSNGSCVAVGSEWVLTTRHQGGGVGTLVEIGGAFYEVVEEEVEPGGGDLRLGRLAWAGGERAELGAWAEVYTGPYAGREVRIGGCGQGRGAASAGGYLWAAGTEELRWGTNRLERGMWKLGAGGYETWCVGMDFSRLGTRYEAAIAAGDSGGGWFLRDGGGWRLAGLSAYVESAGRESRYRPAEMNYGVWVGAYAGWIGSVVRPGRVLAADVNGDGRLDLEDARLLGLWEEN